MTREIKFRAQNFGGYWRYSDKCKNGLGEFFNYFKPDDGSTPILSQNTLGQYTGLKDKNGKEIFEGDIVEWSVWIDAQDSVDGTETHKERFRDSIGFGSGCFKLEKRTELLFNKMAPHMEFEIIGNIYENPNLLK